MELISKDDAIKDAESWVAVDGYEKHLQKIVIEWLKEFPSAELGTNLAEVGTDCISRQASIDALAEDMPSAYTPDGSHPADEGIFMAQEIYADCIQTLKELPPIQPDKDKVSDLLYHIYSIQSPHLDMNGVIAKKYYCEELWKELFGKESELPGWMN